MSTTQLAQELMRRGFPTQAARNVSQLEPPEMQTALNILQDESNDNAACQDLFSNLYPEFISSVNASTGTLRGGRSSTQDVVSARSVASTPSDGSELSAAAAMASANGVPSSTKAFMMGVFGLDAEDPAHATEWRRMRGIAKNLVNAALSDNSIDARTKLTRWSKLPLTIQQSVLQVLRNALQSDVPSSSPVWAILFDHILKNMHDAVSVQRPSASAYVVDLCVCTLPTAEADQGSRASVRRTSSTSARPSCRVNP